VKLRHLIPVAALALCACETLPGPPAEARVTGEVIWGETAAIPTGSTLEVFLVEEGLADGPAPVLDLVRLTVETRRRIDFALSVPPARIAPARTYRVAGVVTDRDGRRTWAAAAPPPVLAFGRPSHVVLVLTPLAGLSEHAAPLRVGQARR
jgi:uncharacterized lipoprotein YbaY